MIAAIVESTTLKFVTVSWAAITYKFVTTTPTMSLTEYGTAVAAILAIWIGREWRKAAYK